MLSSTVAAVQMESRPFAVEENLKRAGKYIDAACKRGAQIVLLPELFHVGYSYDNRLAEFMEEIGGETTQWMRQWSQSRGIYLGACIGERAVGGCYNTFVLAGPSGMVNTYQKRFPAFFENLYFKPGASEGIFSTPIGRIGVMICWDMVHAKLLEEMRGKIDILLISSAWPDMTTGNFPLPGLDHWMTSRTKLMPSRLAKVLNVPVVFANMGGSFKTKIPGLGLTYKSAFAGSSAICHPCGRLVQLNHPNDFVLSDSISIERRRRSKEDAPATLRMERRCVSNRRAA